MALFNTKRLPVSATRSRMRCGRPPWGVGDSVSRSGVMVVHNSSLTKGLLMPSIYHTVMGYVRRSNTTVVVRER
jgi:hypothetical protein